MHYGFACGKRVARIDFEAFVFFFIDIYVEKFWGGGLEKHLNAGFIDLQSFIVYLKVPSI